MKFDLKLLEKYVDETTMCCEKHPGGELNLYGYYSDHITKQPTVWDEVSKHCRGLILDSEGNIIERPFPKFWTFRQYISKSMVLLSEGWIFRIPPGRFRILEKIDGTMVTLYWINNKPYLATQRSFTNIKAIEATKLLYEKYSHLFSKFNKRYTYIFEAVYPETKVLIDYGDTRELYLIGVIDKLTGVPLELPDIGFPLCHDFTSEYGHITDFNELEGINLPNHEGFVIYFQNGEMMKLKFPWYQAAHKLLDFFLHKDKLSYSYYRELSAIKKIEWKIITRQDVENTLSRGDDHLYSLREIVPDFYFLMGYDYWLEKTKALIKGYDKLWNHVFDDAGININPTPEFNVEERMKQPHVFETSVWKWEERYLKH